ncbi:MAG: SpoIIE family protein phosphatase [Candidatus Competibacter sp.]|nr:SpoIIE family protein phosphatase [Candidatus Competibacter sp.]
MNDERMRILVVDDEPTVLKIIAAMLGRWNYEVILAGDGLEAWEILQQQDIRLVISDWMMPRLTGLELCRRLRAAGTDYYVYFILLTGREDKPSLIEGMNAGADDFLVKPVYREELRVRIRAGERILRLEQQLEERNQRLNDINRSLSEAYETVRHDLESAAALQKALLPPPARLPGATVDWLFQPSSYVAGDMFDYFTVNERVLSFYQLDVAGHGVPSALLSFTLNRFLSASVGLGSNRVQEQERDENRFSPPLVVRELNQRFQSNIDPLMYFTMIYGNLNLESGRVMLTQAGHPSPLWLRRDRHRTERVGTGGFPVGMLPEVEYELIDFELAEGDRLFVYSDGVIECENPAGEAFSEQRLRRLLEETAELPVRVATEQVGLTLRDWKGDHPHLDDITLLVLERPPWPRSGLSV